MTDIKHTAAQPLDLDKLEALAKAATPGPWMRLFGERTIYDRMEDGCRGNAIVRADQAYSAKDAANLDFIAAANPATILALIAQARTARLDTTASAVGERIAKLRGALKEVSEVRFGNDGDCGTTRIAEDALYADEQAAAKAPAAQAVPAPSIRTLEFVSLMNAWRNADILNAPAAYDAITAHIDAKLAASPASTPEASQQEGE